MATAERAATVPHSVAPGTPVLGEVIAWSCTGVTVRHIDLIDGLKDAGLDDTAARELAPRHAFARACKKLARERIIRQVAEDQKAITFQFTAERRDGDRFAYELETLLTLDKRTGRVSCPLPGLATLAQEEVDRCVAARTGGDVTRVVQRLFERHADLFPVRDKGGAYFVPAKHAPFLEKVQAFLGRIGGKLGRFPVPAGTPHGDKSVRTAVADGLSAVIAEHAAAVEAFAVDAPAQGRRARRRAGPRDAVQARMLRGPFGGREGPARTRTGRRRLPPADARRRIRRNARGRRLTRLLRFVARHHEPRRWTTWSAGSAV